MLTPSIVLFACIAWTALLFGVALWGERRGHRLSKAWPLIYALSLAVHCTAWTYYGAASQGLQWGFPIPPTLAGMALMIILPRVAPLPGYTELATPVQAVAVPVRSDSLAGLRVLCVDNDEEILDGMRALLGRWQVQVITASTVDRSFRQLQRAVDQHLHLA